MTRRALCVLAAVVASTVATSCSDDGTIIECTGTSREFVGTLVERQGNRAEFVVDEVPKPIDPGPQWPRPDRLPWKVGQQVRVHYIEGTGQYLKIGRQYRVGLRSLDNKVRSDVREANRACSGGTTYADGSAINTSFWIQTHTRRAAVVLPIVTAGTIVVLVFRRRRASRLRLVHLTKHSSNDWWAECLECGTWRSTGHATRRAAAKEFVQHQQLEHRSDAARHAKHE